MAKSSLGRKAMSTLVATTMVVSLNAPVSAWAGNDDTAAEPTAATEQPQAENLAGGGSQDLTADAADATESGEPQVEEGAVAEEATGAAEVATYAAEGEETPAEGNGEATEAVASIGSTTYGSVSEALNSVTTSKSTTIKLLADTVESVSIAHGTNITLDLQGKKITNAVGSHTITNEGGLTITGGGTIDNVTHQRAAIENLQGATCTIKSATVTRSLEAGASVSESGGNSFYYIENYGTMTIGDKNADLSTVVVTSEGHFSSLIHNGWYNGAENTSKIAATMTINAGSFRGGINTVKNDDYGKLTINNGEFKNATQAAVFNCNEATINGGSYESTTMEAVYTIAYDNAMDKGVTTVAGGVFKSAAETDFATVSGVEGFAPKIAVSGGTFSGPVKTEYCADGFEPKQNEDGSYAVSGTVAAIGEETFGTLQSAFDAAKSGDLIVLNKDVDLGDGKVSNYGSKAQGVVVDLGGHSVTSSGSYTLGVSAAGWTFQNGSILNTYAKNTYGAVYCSSSTSSATFKGGEKGLTIIGGDSNNGIFVKTNGGNVKVAIEDGVKVSGKIGVALYGSPSKWGGTYKGKKELNVSGGEITGIEAGVFVQGSAEKNVDDSVTANISGGVVSGGYYAVAGNGTAGYGATTINISGGTLKSISAEGAGIYHPQKGDLNISGGTIEGAVGVQMCSGNITVTGSPSITATGKDETASKTGDGVISDGAAISIVDRGYPGGSPTAKIEGGTFVSTVEGTQAVKAYGWSNNTATEYDNSDNNVAVSGGSFSSIPENMSELCSDGYLPEENGDGTYGVAVDTEDGWYDISQYRTSGGYTAPAAEEGYAFAGWYADKGFNAPIAKDKITGAAVPRYVEISELIHYMGGSLRMDGPDAAVSTSLRFGYITSAPKDATYGKTYWTWTDGSTEQTPVYAKNRVLFSNGAAMANLVVDTLPKEYYGVTFHVTEHLAYTTGDGTSVEVAEANAQEHSVNSVASAIISNSGASADEIAYAKQILGEEA